jgi:hypothetical protein
MACFLLVPDYQAAALLQVTNASLDRISIAILLFVAGWWATGTLSDVSPNRNGRLDPFIRAPLPDPVGIVGPISSDRLGALARSSSGPRDRYLVHQVGEEGRLVALAG